MEYTLITAFKEILEPCHHSQLKQDSLESCKEALDFLAGKLNINEFQACLLSIFINQDEEISTADIADYLDIPLIDFLSRLEKVDDLVRRKYILRTNEEGNVHPNYKIVKAAIQNIMKNEEPAKAEMHCENYFQFMERLTELHQLLMFESCLNEDYKSDLLELTQANQHLPVCQFVKDYGADDQILYYICFKQLMYQNSEVTPVKEIQHLYRKEIGAPIINALVCNQLPLLKDGLISFHNKAQTELSLRADICRRLKEEHNIFSFFNHPGFRKGCKADQEDEAKNDSGYVTKLIAPSTLDEKHLYYNTVEAEAIDKLTHMLKPANFQRVQLRMEDHHMNKGLCCLFYGDPGTGKTETVKQIARQTHRYVQYVDFAQIRSKWVGESGKHVREFFDQYRKICEKSDNMPILLLNEADGLISQRVSRISQTSDKEENALQNIILEEMERFEGILIATTNLQDNLDPAFERRFLYKLQFHTPSAEIQQKIWLFLLTDLTPSDAQRLSVRYKFSGAQIENVARKHLIESIFSDSPLQFDELQGYCEQELLKSKTKLKPVVGFGI